MLGPARTARSTCISLANKAIAPKGSGWWQSWDDQLQNLLISAASPTANVPYVARKATELPAIQHFIDC